jgi:glycosyltransferase involved in cell wall biosynthesis
MMKTPLISIIVPIYNSEDYIARCVDTLITQSYKNIEIILVDDGSTDNTAEICDRYAAQDKRVRVIHKTNEGPSVARNKGIEAASGSYLTFVDSDDWIHPDYCKRLLLILTQTGADISVCGHRKVTQRHYTKTHLRHPKVKSMNSHEALLKGYPMDSIVVGKLYHVGVIDTIRFPKGRFHEDEFTTYKFINNAKLVVETNECLYFYYQREGSRQSNSMTIRNVLDATDAFEEKAFLFENLGCVDLRNLAYRRHFGLFREVFKKHVMSRNDPRIKDKYNELKKNICSAEFNMIYKLKCKIYFALENSVWRHWER